MKKKNIKEVLVLVVFTLVLSNVCGGIEQVNALVPYSTPSQDKIDKYKNKGYQACSYNIVFKNSADDGYASYSNKKVILVLDRNAIKYISPSGELLSGDQNWNNDTEQSIGFNRENMYNYLVSNGKLDCSKGLMFSGDPDFGTLTIVDGNTAASGDLHAGEVIDLLGGETNTDSISEQFNNQPSGEQAGVENGDETPAVQTCEGILGEHVMEDIKTILGYARIVAPILVIILSIVDFSKAVLVGDDKELSKAVSSLVKRLIAAVAIFFVPLILSYLLDTASQFIEHTIDNCDMKGW